MSFLQTFLKCATVPAELAVVSVDVLREEITRRQLSGDTSTVEACVDMIVADNLATAQPPPSKSPVQDSEPPPLTSDQAATTDNDATDEDLLAYNAKLTDGNDNEDDDHVLILDDDILLSESGDQHDTGKNSLPLDPPPSPKNEASNQDDVAEDIKQEPDLTPDIVILDDATPDPATPEPAAPVVVPFYDGEPTASVTSFLEAVDRWAAQGCADDFRKHDFAMGRLTGMAADWQLYAGNRHHTWSAWREALQRRFRHVLTADEWFSRIRARVQGTQESLQHYAGQMLVLFLEPPEGKGLGFDRKFKYIVNGLAHNSHRVALRASKIKDEDELMSKLVIMDRDGPSSEGITRPRSTAAVKTKTTTGTSSTEKKSTGAATTKSSASRTAKARTCFRCKSDQHLSASCPLPCKICNDPEHTERRCPENFDAPSSDSAVTRPPSGRPCYRCSSIDHLAQDCPEPCRHCQGTGHTTRRCPQKPGATTKKPASDSRPARPTSSSRPTTTNQSNSSASQKVKRTCYRCGLNTHLSYDCPKPCILCNEPGHLLKSCPLYIGQTTKSNGSRAPTAYDNGNDISNFHTCYHCGSRQHEARNCPLMSATPAFTETPSLRCRRCGSHEHYEMDCPLPCPVCRRDGHTVKNCPDNYDRRPSLSRSPSPSRISTGASQNCYRCGSNQHLIRNCPQPCSLCYEPGHTVSECPVGRRSKSARSFSPPSSPTNRNRFLCHRCGSSRHLVIDCPEPCPLCNQPGHMKKQCPNYPGGRSSMPENNKASNSSTTRLCYRCGSSTHIIKNCRMPCARCNEVGHSQTECPYTSMNQSKRTSSMSRTLSSPPPTKRGNWSDNSWQGR